MGRILLAAFVGAIVYFAWGMLAWMALPIHEPTIRELPDESSITESLRGRNLETGIYLAPAMDENAMTKPEESTFVKNHEAGPIYMIIYHREGLPVMGTNVLAFGFLIDFVAAGIAACMLHSALGGCCTGNYAARVGFVAGFGFFVALIGHLNYYNWMAFPLDYTLAFCIDVIVGWTLAGLAIAAIIKPAAPPTIEIDAPAA